MPRISVKVIVRFRVRMDEFVARERQVLRRLELDFGYADNLRLRANRLCVRAAGIMATKCRFLLTQRVSVLCCAKTFAFRFGLGVSVSVSVSVSIVVRRC